MIHFVYRLLNGGIWYRYKLGNDTPNINMFTAWLKESPNDLDMTVCTLLEVRDYGRGLKGILTNA